MPKRNTTSLGGPKSSRFGSEVAWVDVDLTKEQKIECKAWCNTLEELDKAIDVLEAARYRMSIKPDDYSGGYAAFVQGLPDCEDNKGLILTGRGSSPLKAVKQALYKHYMVLREVWPVQKSKRELEEFDD